MGAVKAVPALPLLFAIFVLHAAAGEPGGDAGWIRGYARHSDKDNPIPRELVTKLEKDYKTATADPKLPTAKTVNRHLMIPIAELTEEQPRALKGQTRIIAPPGGGTVDLADEVTALRGAFHLKIKLENDRYQEQPVSKVYFISQARERKVDGEKFGSGCGKYFDITSYYKKQMNSGGFTLYTADQRYVSVLRGTFVFVTYAPEALQLASLTFLDSRYSSWDCPQPEVL